MIALAVAGVTALAVGAIWMARRSRPTGQRPRPEPEHEPPPKPREDPRAKLREQYEREAVGMTREDLYKEPLEGDPLTGKEAVHRHIVALHSQDRELRMAALREVCDTRGRHVCPGHTQLDPLLDLLDRREGVERGHLAFAVWQTRWSLPYEGADELRRRVSSRVLAAIVRTLPTLTPKEMRQARLHYVLDQDYDFKLLKPDEIEPFFRILLELMGTSDVQLAHSAVRGAAGASCFVPNGLDRFVERATALWDRTDLEKLIKFRHVAIYALLYRTESDAPRALMERAAVSGDPSLQRYAFFWMRGRADRAAGKAKGRRVVYDWVIERLASGDQAGRAAMLRYIAGRWDRIEANWLDASTVVLHLGPDEIEAFQRRKPRPIVLQTILEVNKPPASP